MSDPQRLLDGATGFERQLLRSARSDDPSAAAYRKAAACLGVAVTTTAVGTGTAAAGGTLAATTAASGGMSLVVFVKCLAVGMLAGAAVIASWSILPSEHAPVGPVATATTHAHAVAPPLPSEAAKRGVATGPSLSVGEVVAPAVAAEPPVVRTRAPLAVARGPEAVARVPEAVAPTPLSARASKKESDSVSEPSSSTAGSGSSAAVLAQESALLDRARAAMVQGDAVRAKKLLEDHEASFARAPLARESEVMRIEVCAKTGDRARARAMADAFLATSPSGALSRRVRALVVQYGL